MKQSWQISELSSFVCVFISLEDVKFKTWFVDLSTTKLLDPRRLLCLVDFSVLSDLEGNKA